MNRLLFLFILFTISITLLKAQTTTLSLNPTKDATINSVLEEQNFGSDNLRAQSWMIEETEFSERILIAFDLEGIPSNAYIISAQLKLFGIDHQVSGEGNNQATLDYLTEEWSESEVNWDNQPMATQEMEIENDAPDNSTDNLIIDLTTWVRMQMAGSDVPENNGFLIRQLEEQIYAKRSYYSREVEETSLRPVLEVEYRIPSPIDASLTSSMIDQYLTNSGSIQLNIESGDAPFQYQWSANTNESSSVSFVDGLSAGTYSVTITDANQITEVQSAGVGHDPDWKAYNSNRFDYINHKLKKVNNVSNWYGIMESGQILQSSDGWIEYTIEEYSGRKMIGIGQANNQTYNDWRDIEYGVYLKNDNTFNLVTSGSQNALGSFSVGDIIRLKREGTNFKVLKNGDVISSANRSFTGGLSGEISAKIVMFDPETEISDLRTSFGEYLEIRFDQKAEEESNSNGEIGLSIYGGVEPYTYQWSNGSSSASIENLSAGDYTVTITDANGTKKVKKTTLKSGSGWNWEDEIIYDNNGNKLGHSKVYFDDLENEVQSQSYLITEDNILASQTVYDKHGRAVLSSLPAPVFETAFDYQEDLLESSSGTEYEYSNFDQPISSSNSLGEVNNPMSVYNGKRGGVGWYYSNNNTAEPYQATTSFPYTRTEFSKLNPGRAKRSSSPHNSMKMGSGHETESYSMPVAGELAYFYGYANGWEINPGGGVGVYDQQNPTKPIFRSDPDFPFQKKAIKNVHVDQNGLVSVVFKDLDGRVIASCMSGTDGAGNNINEYNVASKIDGEAGSYVDIHLPKECESTLQDFENPLGGKSYKIFDLKTEEVIYTGDGQSISFPSGSSGFYRIIDRVGGDITTIRYKLNYYNITLNYYDKNNRLKHTISPSGFDYDFNMSGLNISANRSSSEFDWDPNGTLNYPDDWKLVSHGTGIAGGTPEHSLDHSITANPNPTDDLQYSNILVYIAQDGDPQALTVNEVNLGQVQAALEPEEGGPEGTPPAAEDFYVSSSGNGIVSSVGGNTGSADRISGGGSGDTDWEEELPPCGQYPRDLAKYWYKIKLLTHVEYVEGGVTKKKTLANFNSTTNQYIPQVIVAKYKFQDADDWWNPASATMSWSFSNLSTDNSDATDIGLADRSVEGAIIYSVGNEISKGITKVSVEIVDIEGETRLTTYHQPNPPYCTYFTWRDVPYYDFQRIEDDLELRVKDVTTKLVGTDIAPQHTIHEIYDYNALGQTTNKWSEDDGATDYVYTKEGLLRFSQNEEQRNATPKRFSYTNYDNRGRVVESGEAKEGNAANLRFQNHEEDITMNPGDVAITGNNILNYKLDHIDLTDQEKIEPSYYVYDTPYPNFSTYTTEPNVGSNYSQKRTWGKLSYSYNKLGSAIKNTTLYSYDPYGRVEWKIQDVAGLGVKTEDIIYTDRGEVESVVYQKYEPTEYFEHIYAYDLDGRLKKTYTRASGGIYSRPVEEAEYFYYLHGPLKRVELAGNLQGIDYIYNTLGYLKAINSPELGSTEDYTFHDPGGDGQNGFAPDVFGMSLDYFSGDYSRQGTYVNSGNNYRDQFNGNIKAMRWNTQNQTSGDNYHWLYSFQYNKNGWLEDAQFGKYSPACQNLGAMDQACVAPGGPSLVFDANDAYRVNNITYDKVGNIQTLKRRATNGTLMDNFTYNYQTNHPSRLDYLADAEGEVYPGVDLSNQSAANYTYDELGRMTDDGDRKLIYNSYGLVKEVKEYDQTSATYIPVVKYFYDENGQRLAKTSYQNGTPWTKKWYVGGVEYHEGLILGAGITNIEYDINGSSRLGTFSRSNSLRRYELTDHLGNVRATVSKNTGGGLNLMSYTDYYPFGSEMPGRKFVSGDHYTHKYQGQFTEHDEEVNWEAFELRNWDGRLARWTSTDPAGQFWSPYLGMGNNPINQIDPDGAYSKFGAWWRNGFSSEGLEFRSDGEWGYYDQTSTPGRMESVPLGNGETMNFLSEVDITLRFGKQSAVMPFKSWGLQKIGYSFSATALLGSKGGGYEVGVLRDKKSFLGFSFFTTEKKPVNGFEIGVDAGAILVRDHGAKVGEYFDINRLGGAGEETGVTGGVFTGSIGIQDYRGTGIPTSYSVVRIGFGGGVPVGGSKTFTNTTIR